MSFWLCIYLYLVGVWVTDIENAGLFDSRPMVRWVGNLCWPILYPIVGIMLIVRKNKY